MAAHLIAIRRPAMHAGDLLPHPPPQLLATRWRHDASIGAGIRWMGRRTSPARRTARPLGGLAHCRDGQTPSRSCAAHAPPGHPDAHGPASGVSACKRGMGRTSGCTWTGHLSRITAMRAASGAAARRSGEQGASVAQPILFARRVTAWPVTTSNLLTMRRSPSVARLRSARTGSAHARPSPLARAGAG